MQRMNHASKKKTQIGRNAQVGVSSKMDPGRLIAKNKYFPMNCEVNCGCLLNITFSFCALHRNLVCSFPGKKSSKKSESHENCIHFLSL